MLLAVPQKINVTLGNDEVLEGTIVGSCAIHDIAVVKVKGKIFKRQNLGTLTRLGWGKESTPSATPLA